MRRRGFGPPPRRGPGLLGTMARTAVVAGTATAVSRGVSTSMDAAAQQQAALAQMKAAQEQQRIDAAVQQALAQQQAAPPPASSSEDRITKLQQLAELKRQGILSDDEFEAEKARVLAS